MSGITEYLERSKTQYMLKACCSNCGSKFAMWFSKGVRADESTIKCENCEVIGCVNLYRSY